MNDKFIQILETDTGKQVMFTDSRAYTKDGKTYSQDFSGESRLADLQKSWIEEERKKLGITSSDIFSPSLIRQYEQMQNNVQGNLIPGLEQSKAIQAPVTINIDKPVVMDNAALAQMADQVAGVIEPALDKAISNAQNGY